MKFQPTPYQIIATLDALGIKHDTQPNHKGWLSIQCPNPTHFEENHDNCSININNSSISCFSCGYGKKGNAKFLVNAVMDRLHYEYKEAIQFIEQGISSYTPRIEIQQEKPKPRRKRSLYNFTMTDLNPNDFLYTRSRGFTQEFIDTFNIKHAISNWFEDYMIIPIIDTEKGINEYEGRKLKEYETLCRFYDIENSSLSKLKDNFEQLCKHNLIKINKKDFKLYMDKEEYNNHDVYYLLKPKTLYIANSRCQETIWNIDNLKYDEDLYVVEGLGSVASIWSSISKNVTAIFGVSITEDQIKYLQRFKRIIYIPDFDKAGFDSVSYLRCRLNNLIICDTQYEDTDKEYLSTIIEKNFISSNDYITKYAYQFKFPKR